MKLSDLRKETSDYKIAKTIGITPHYFRLQCKFRGFSANTIRKIKRHYPEIEVDDLLINYPKKTE